MEVADKLLESVVNLVDVLDELVIVGAAEPHVALITFEVFVVIVQGDAMSLKNLFCTEAAIANVARPIFLLLLDLVLRLRPEVLLQRNFLRHQRELRRARLSLVVAWRLFKNLVDDEVELIAFGGDVHRLHFDVHGNARVLDVEECGGRRFGEVPPYPSEALGGLGIEVGAAKTVAR